MTIPLPPRKSTPRPPGGRRLSAAVAVGLIALTATGAGAGQRTDTPAAVLPPGPRWPASTACDASSGRVLSVGPGQPYAAPSAAAAAARDGDVVRIRAGDYRGDVATWRASRLTICGHGGRARLFADGRHAGGKAIWVIAGADITIDGIEFHGARVPDHNGAGIRAEHRRGELRVLNSGFYDNQTGLLSAAGPVAIHIEGSEFARSDTGTLAALGHNLYVGRIDRLTVRRSFLHEAVRGHNLKSRARVSVIESSYLMDGPAGRSSYLADFPDGGAVTLRGNLLHKGPRAENPTAVAFGAESLGAGSIHTLDMRHNTLVMTRRGGHFLRAPPGTQSVHLTANIWAGTDPAGLITGGFDIGRAVQRDNARFAASDFPGADALGAPRFWPRRATPALPAQAGASVEDLLHDSPQPFVERLTSGRPRMAGALQSAP